MRRRRVIATAAAITLTLAILPATPSWADSPQPIPVGVEEQPSVSADTNTIIVTFDQNQADPAAAARAAVKATGATIAKVSPINGKTVTVALDPAVTPAQTAAIGDKVEAVAGVKAAQPATAFTTGTTNDTYYSYLWNISSSVGGANSVDAEAAWPTTTGRGVVVGVIDTGITAHSDLSGTVGSIVGGNLVAGYDFISNVTAAGDGDGRDSDPSDSGDWSGTETSSWHGTHVAGIIAAIGNNSTGVVGVAPGAKVQPIRALGEGGGSEADIISAIYWGAGLAVSGAPVNPTPANVLNMSLGGTAACSVAMQAAINAAVTKGVTVVVAAGNEARPVSTSMPANCNNVVSVAATGPTGAIAEYSNYGNATRAVTIAAPGGSNACSTDPHACIASTWNYGATTVGSEGYGLMAGTSMAAPHVAAAAAMLKAVDPTLTPAQIQTYLTGTTTALPACGMTCGAGLLNVANAVTAAVNPVDSLATPIIAGTPMIGATVSTQGAGASGATYSYQWLRNTQGITGATDSSYTLVASDLDTNLSVTVTATYAGRSASKSSVSTAVVPNSVTSLAIPIISGTATVGAPLSTVGVGATGATYSYQWLRNGDPVSGATGARYLLTNSDLATNVSARVTASLYGQSKAQVSASKLVGANSVGSLAVPVISGAVKVGSTLTTVGTGATGATYSYQWLRNGATIPAATTASYMVTASDVGRSLTVMVTATMSGISNSKMSAQTARVTAGTFSRLASPYTSGTYKKTKTVRAHTGTWSPTATAVKYRWLRNGATIKGATKSTYKLPKSMKGKYISVKVTVIRAGYTTTTATSAKHKVG